LWGNNDIGHTAEWGWKGKGGNERNETIAGRNGTVAKANTDEKIMPFALAAVECSSGVKLRNAVKGLRLCGLLRLMALLQ
jgi:hypothetical protein